MPLSALDFSGRAGEYGFGNSSEPCARTLRAIADMIDAKQVVVQSARVTGLASNENFTLTGIRLVLAEKMPVELRGMDSKFPEAVAGIEAKEA